MTTSAPPPSKSQFPDDFVWGVATSAFQIEGAALQDGKGPSIWDSFCRQPGAIADNSNGDIACEHYARWSSDLDMIADLGVDAYAPCFCGWPQNAAGTPGPSGTRHPPAQLQLARRLQPQPHAAPPVRPRAAPPKDPNKAIATALRP